MHLVPPGFCTTHCGHVVDTDADRQTADRQTADKQTDRQTDRQTGRHRQAGRQADRQAGRQARLTDRKILQVKANVPMDYQKLTITCR